MSDSMDDRKHVFVFGSNLAGRHGAGAARAALENWGAIYGQGAGRQGMSYGIPTRNRHIRTLSLDEIKHNVELFMLYAARHPELIFDVTRIGCGLAGYKDEEIAPFFVGAPSNCNLPEGWRKE